MKKSRSLSEGSLPPPEDDADSVSSDELLRSRRRLTELLSGDPSTVGPDGLFVDPSFPLGELEMQPGVRWKRPKVKGGGGLPEPRPH